MADCRIDGVDRGVAFQFTVDGDSITAFPGETVASAVYATGRRGLRRSTRLAETRGLYCNMGVCFECLIYDQGRAVRACMLVAEEGMELRSFAPLVEES